MADEEKTGTCCAQDGSGNDRYCGTCLTGADAEKCATCINNDDYTYDENAKTCTPNPTTVTCSSSMTDEEKTGTCCAQDGSGNDRYCGTCLTGADAEKCATCINNDDYTYDENAKTCTPKPKGVTCSSSMTDEEKTGTCCAQDGSGNDRYCGTCLTGADAEKCATCINNNEYTYDENAKTCTLKTKPSGCDILNCKTCNSDGTKCTVCNDNYGLKAGICQKCAEGYWISGSQKCRTRCTIENCDECIFENGIEYCTDCSDYYYESDDKKSCIAYTCSDLYYSCEKCNSTTPPFTCDKYNCNAGDHLVAGENGCECAEGYKGYAPYCYTPEEYQCVSNVEDCRRCANSDHCTECFEGYKLTDGKCEFITVTCPMTHCKSCYNEEGNTHCDECDDNYNYNKKLRQCYRNIEVDCTTKIEGCLKCYDNMPDKCMTCDSSKFLKPSTINFGTCICDDDHDYVNGKCVEPIGPVVEPEIEYKDLSVEKDGEHYKLKGDNIQNTDNYQVTLEQAVDYLNIPTEIPNVRINLNGQNDFTVNPANANTKINIVCNQNTNLNIPAANENINLTGSGTINVKPNGNADTIKLNKVSPQGDGITLTSDKNIEITQVQVFKKSKIVGQTGGKTTTCDKIILEGGSELDLEQVTVKEALIGITSILNLEKNNVNVKDTKFHIYFNRTLGEGVQFPIVIKKVLPDLSQSSIDAVNYDAGEQILKEGEALPIATYEDVTGNVKEHCDNLAKKFSSSAGFGNAECVEHKSDDKTTYSVTSKKAENKPDDDDKGLSGGAIAGIVIACVVVVAAIIALLVYFLVIKKKNDATTSTQGDSSIAI